jgi:hypothetical protein
VNDKGRYRQLRARSNLPNFSSHNPSLEYR